MSITFEIKSIDKLLRKLEPRRFEQAVKALTRGVAEVLRGHLAKAPGPVKRPIQWASRKQQVWYMHARAGMGPYVRNSDPWSQRIGPSWATENRGLDAAVGTRVTYAPWVQSDAQQQPMHRNTGWVTDRQAIEQAQQEGAAQKVADKVIGSWIRD